VKILWAKSDFLHPTDRGGQIRTLEMVKRLHARHELHYIGFAEAGQTEGPARAPEYSSRSYALAAPMPTKGTARFYQQLVLNLPSALPAVIFWQRSEAMRRKISELLARENYDVCVCDFLFPAINIPDVSRWILFQHNVETIIWRRHASTAGNFLSRRYFQNQAERMERFEGDICRRFGGVVAVSENDARTMEKEFELANVAWVPTGVDLESLSPPPGYRPAHPSDLVFVGSMDWLPNIDGMRYFMAQILPRLRQQKPDLTLTIAGRRPTQEILGWAAADPRVRVTGTVADIRPYLWGASISIVPLRIGGGTRLKIYESMAARVPVVSTTIGAEGLEIDPPHNIRIADTDESFAAQCLALLADAEARRAVSEAAWAMVSRHYGWESVTRGFEDILAGARAR